MQARSPRQSDIEGAGHGDDCPTACPQNNARAAKGKKSPVFIYALLAIVG